MWIYDKFIHKTKWILLDLAITYSKIYKYKTMLNRLIDIMLLLRKEEPCLTAVRNVMARVVRFEYVYFS